MLPLEDSKEFNMMLNKFAFTTVAGREATKNLYLGFDPELGTLITTRITAATVGSPKAARKDKLPIYEDWEHLLNDFTESAPKGLRSAFQYAGPFWCHMESEKAMYEGAIQGIVVSVSLAFVILILATKNLIVAVYAIISVIFVVSNIVAVMYLLGWELGIPESVATVIVIGLSVDYIVHLAAHFVHSPLYNRN